MSEKLHTPASRYGVLLVNLGTPDEPTAKAVSRYLREFLSDTRVVEIPPFVWFWILNGIILPIRSKKVAKAYASIWTEQGSPLRAITEQQVVGVKKALAEHFGETIEVNMAMTYGNPSIKSQMAKMQEQGIDKIAVIPLYPQYSATTTAAVFDKMNGYLKTVRNLPEVRFLKDYYRVPAYTQALANSVTEFWQKEGKPNKLMFSFHGIPKRCVNKGDPYFEHCQYTATQTAALLGLKDDEWLMTFQSRFGAEEWLKPYTDETLEALGQSGVERVDVICPAFAADCLETLEEISFRGQKYFESFGGKTLTLVPSLNSSRAWVETICHLITKQN